MTGDRAPAMSRWGLVAAVTLILATVGTVAVVAWPPGVGSPVDDGGAGASELADVARDLGYDVRASLLGEDLAEGQPMGQTLHVYLSTPDAQGRAAPGDVLEAVDGGARALVADGGGSAELLTPWGWVLDPVTVYSGRPGVEDPNRVILEHTVDGEVLRVESVAPRPLLPIDDDRARGTPIRTTGAAFSDLNGDGRLDDQDARGPFVVGIDATTDRGGRLVYLTSPYPLTNLATDTADGQAFQEALMASMLPDGGTVVFHVTAAPHPAGIEQANHLAALGYQALSCTPCQVAGGLVAAGALAAAVRRRSDLRDWSEHTTDLEQIRRPDPPPDQEIAIKET